MYTISNVRHNFPLVDNEYPLLTNTYFNFELNFDVFFEKSLNDIWKSSTVDGTIRKIIKENFKVHPKVTSFERQRRVANVQRSVQHYAESFLRSVEYKHAFSNGHLEVKVNFKNLNFEHLTHRDHFTFDINFNESLLVGPIVVVSSHYFKGIKNHTIKLVSLENISKQIVTVPWFTALIEKRKLSCLSVPPKAFPVIEVLSDDEKMLEQEENSASDPDMAFRDAMEILSESKEELSVDSSIDDEEWRKIVQANDIFDFLIENAL